MLIKPSKILSIDWDYITGDCAKYDINYFHPHCGFCKDKTISNRRGKSDKLDVMWEEKEERILKLKISNAPIFVAECHANILDLLNYCETPIIYDFDSHCDKYDDLPFVHCGNWIYHLTKIGGEVYYRPRKIGSIGAIFICHSSPWTPRSMDENFFRFIKKISKKTKSEIKFIGHRKVSLRNGYGNV